MSENNKHFKLIRDLSDLMREKRIALLEYQASSVKLKIQHTFEINENTQSTQSVKIQPDNLQKETKQTKELSSNHPGAVKSPMVGTAYASPEPGKEPFIKLGDQVVKGQPLVIIEAMKVMNTINSEKNGKIIFIGFEDGQPIEFEQLLVIIE